MVHSMCAKTFIFSWQFCYCCLSSTVKETNTYGAKKVESKWRIPKSFCFHKRQHTNYEELLAFFRLVINMGMVRNSSLNDYWDMRNWSQSAPFLPAVFTRNCFLKLLSMLLFPEVEGDTSRMRKIQYTGNILVSRLDLKMSLKRNFMLMNV